MTKFLKVEEILAWQEAVNLAIEIYSLTDRGKFSKDFSLRDQIRRSVVSIASNIAEGFERGTKQEFIRFLYIAKGSCGELRTQFYIAFKLEYIEENSFKEIENKCLKISGMIGNLIKSLKKRANVPMCERLKV